MLSLLTAVVLLPLVGLAIDGGILYLMKAKLSAAVDAAALAGARSLSVGMDISSQTASATATSQSFFYANFPNGYWKTSNLSLNTVVAQTAYKTRTVTMQASVTVPLTFMRILGQSAATVQAEGQTSRRDVNMIVVLDRSNSMALAGVCDTMVSAARGFIEKFANGRDNIGLITFMESYNVDYSPTLNFKSNTPSLDTTLSKLKCGGDTGTAQAIDRAHDQIKQINQPGALNLIVLFTDGQPNGITADFPVKTQKDKRYDSYNTNSVVTDNPSGCASTTNKLGAIASWGGAPAPTTGATGGLLNYMNSSISSTSLTTISNSNGCAFGGSSSMTNEQRMREDIAYIPLTDHWGNATTGYQPFAPNTETYPSTNPYYGQVRVDSPSAIVTASTNAADNAATAARNDPTYTSIIYAIGLGGTSAAPIDTTFMCRISNDPCSPIYNSSKPNGLYIYAPTADDLNDAFQRVASEILRISQ
jgi:Mg-chelatase subunit ChlD